MRAGRPRLNVSRRAVTIGLSSLPLLLTGTSAVASEAADIPPGFPETPGPFGMEGIGAAPTLKALPFALGDVRLLNGAFLDAQNWNIAFIKRIDPNRLLHAFRLNAGLPSNAKPLGGWETPGGELRGHFSGHYLSACALAFATTGDAELKRRGDDLVAGLALCQHALGKSGYLSAFPLEEFERLDSNRIVWAPFYTIHKIMAGLLEMHLQTGSAEALAVLNRMAGWVDSWTAARTPAHMQADLDNEFGGMSETLYNLSAATGDVRWIGVGDRFIKTRFMNPLMERRDELRGLHMNTHVPQVIGAARRYVLTGDPSAGKASVFFWDTVVEARTYVTGGSSNREHWLTAPDRLADEWCQDSEHQECCCSYNMMKLTRALYQVSPQVRYIDYYERNLLNHRLGTIEPLTGRSTYFLSLAPGAWKTLATDDDSFWCCTGTAMEDFAKLNDTIYARDHDGLFVNLFIESQLHWAERGVVLRQSTRFPEEPVTRIEIEESPRDPWSLRVRIPGWTTRETRILLNGAPLEVGTEPGSYLDIRRVWRRGDRVEMHLDMPLHTESMPDNPSLQAFVVGPIVLAGQFPGHDLAPDLRSNQQGPQMHRAPAIKVPAITAAGRPATESLRMKGLLAYSLETAAGKIDLKPLNQSWDRFAVYWTVT